MGDIRVQTTQDRPNSVLGPKPHRSSGIRVSQGTPKIAPSTTTSGETLASQRDGHRKGTVHAPTKRLALYSSTQRHPVASHAK